MENIAEAATISGKTALRIFYSEGQTFIEACRDKIDFDGFILEAKNQGFTLIEIYKICLDRNNGVFNSVIKMKLGQIFNCY